MTKFQQYCQEQKIYNLLGHSENEAKNNCAVLTRAVQREQSTPVV